MNRIKVLQIIRGLDIGGDSGGAELFGIKLAQQFHKDPTYQVMICAFFSVGTAAEEEWLKKLNAEGIETFILTEWGGYTNSGRFFGGVLRLIRKIKHLEIDVIHSHFQLGSAAAVMLKLLGLTKTAFRTSHIRLEWNEGKYTWFLHRLFIRWLFPKVLDGEIGVSNAVCDYLRARKIAPRYQEKIHLIYNGIDVEQIISASRQMIHNDTTRNLGDDVFILGCVGRLTDQKGYIYIIPAMKSILAAIPECKLFIVGDGENRAQLEKLVSDLELSDNVFFLGLRNDVPALLTRWNAFVLSSLWEGLPTNVMEAMVCNIPVIATDIPGTRELVIHEETGLLVQPQDIDGLAQAVIRLYHDPALKEKIVNSARSRVTQFDMSEIRNQYALLYRQALGTQILEN